MNTTVNQVYAPRATLDELLEFCNKVREAGGGDVLNELLPGVPYLDNACLIARNLNFSCRVSGGFMRNISWRAQYDDHEMKWFMFVSDSEVRRKIADALDLPIDETLSRMPGILLPKEIGRAAAAFDSYHDISTSEFGDLWMSRETFLESTNDHA